MDNVLDAGFELLQFLFFENEAAHYIYYCSEAGKCRGYGGMKNMVFMMVIEEIGLETDIYLMEDTEQTTWRRFALVISTCTKK